MNIEGGKVKDFRLNGCLKRLSGWVNQKKPQLHSLADSPFLDLWSWQQSISNLCLSLCLEFDLSFHPYTLFGLWLRLSCLLRASLCHCIISFCLFLSPNPRMCTSWPSFKPKDSFFHCYYMYTCIYIPKYDRQSLYNVTWIYLFLADHLICSSL